MSKIRIKAKSITPQELRNHPNYEESNNWNDAFSYFDNSPKVIVPDENRLLFYIWFGGESHYVHLYSLDGKEFDVFSFGFEKDRLDEKEVLSLIERHLNEDKGYEHEN